MRKIKSEIKHFLETQILGAYETADVNWQSDLQGEQHRCFEDTEISVNETSVITERKMIVDGRTFTVCSIFPSEEKATPTEKMLKIIGSDLDNN